MNIALLKETMSKLSDLRKKKPHFDSTEDGKILKNNYEVAKQVYLENKKRYTETNVSSQQDIDLLFAEIKLFISNFNKLDKTEKFKLFEYIEPFIDQKNNVIKFKDKLGINGKKVGTNFFHLEFVEPKEKSPKFPKRLLRGVLLEVASLGESQTGAEIKVKFSAISDEVKTALKIPETFDMERICSLTEVFAALGCRKYNPYVTWKKNGESLKNLGLSRDTASDEIQVGDILKG